MPVVPKFPPKEVLEPQLLAVMGDRYRWTAEDAAKGVDLDGKTVLVTGGTSGIGVPLVKALASTGARVVVTARDAAKGQQLASEAKGKVEVWEMDLARLKSVDALVERAKKEGVVFDRVVNNAGLMAQPFAKSEDGYEMQLQVNYLAPVVLLSGLVGAGCLSREGGRVVLTSSIAHKRGMSWPLNWDSEEGYDKWTAYADAKSAIIMYGNALDKHLGEGVTVNSVHPGGIRTGLQSGLTMEEMAELGWYDSHGTLNPGFKSVEEGAATSAWGAVSEELEGKGGHYLENCAVTPRDDYGSEESVLHRSRGTAPHVWDEEKIRLLVEETGKRLGRTILP